jgi:hypothetical protein
MQISRKHLALLVIGVLAVAFRLGTTDWSMLDYLGLAGLSLVGIFLGASVFGFIFLIMLDLECPVRAKLAEWMGYEYKNDYSCGSWKRKDTL